MAQCRCDSEILQAHVQSASVRWDMATLAIAEAWLAEHSTGPVARGTKQVQSLPVAKAMPGLGVAQDAVPDAARSAFCA